MVRALLPVTFALTLAVVAGVLLAQSGVFRGGDFPSLNLSAASGAGGSCCSSARSSESQTSLASGEAQAGEGAGCCSSRAKFTSMEVEDQKAACPSTGCPFTTASSEGKSCSAGGQCCSAAGEACQAGSGKHCSAEGGESCCSGKEKCCSEDTDGADSETTDVVAAVAD